MDRQEIKAHWTNWSETFGDDLRATTKTWTLKALEIDALTRRISNLIDHSNSALVLEAGCGNGSNCLELAKRFPKLTFHGFDFVPSMVASASDRAKSEALDDRVQFFESDVLDLGSNTLLESHYQIVFTDRCLINLNTLDLQRNAISALAGRVAPDGHLLMIENSQQTYDNQNRCRTLLGLEPRKPADFNYFFVEDQIRQHLATIGIKLEDVEDFISLHDLMLYVLLPAINGGKIEYDHPLVAAATRLNIGMSLQQPNAFGTFGQNRLFVCHKTTSDRPR
jgi:SAM-dependent methyltransferase